MKLLLFIVLFALFALAMAETADSPENAGESRADKLRNRLGKVKEAVSKRLIADWKVTAFMGKGVRMRSFKLVPGETNEDGSMEPPTGEFLEFGARLLPLPTIWGRKFSKTKGMDGEKNGFAARIAVAGLIAYKNEDAGMGDLFEPGVDTVLHRVNLKAGDGAKQWGTPDKGKTDVEGGSVYYYKNTLGATDTPKFNIEAEVSTVHTLRNVTVKGEAKEIRLQKPNGFEFILSFTDLDKVSAFTPDKDTRYAMVVATAAASIGDDAAGLAELEADTKTDMAEGDAVMPIKGEDGEEGGRFRWGKNVFCLIKGADGNVTTVEAAVKRSKFVKELPKGKDEMAADVTDVDSDLKMKVDEMVEKAAFKLVFTTFSLMCDAGADGTIVGFTWDPSIEAADAELDAIGSGSGSSTLSVSMLIAVLFALLPFITATYM